MWRQKAADQTFLAHVETALQTLTVIEAANAEDEALAIAVALREAVHEGKTAALVTPDRALGHRVLAALKRWDIAAEDSGGDALADTPAGTFARLAAEAALGGLAPVTLLALLKHPLLADRHRSRHRDARTRDPARAASASGRARACARATDFPRPARQIPQRRQGRSAPLRSAHSLKRRRAPNSRRSRRRARRGTGVAGKPRHCGAPAQRACRSSSRRHRRLRRRRGLHGSRRNEARGRARRTGDKRRRGRLGGRAIRLRRAVCRSACRQGRAAARQDRFARAHPRPAGSASHRERSRRARRPGRRHLAAGKPHRCLAQPADAAQARPRSAGTPHRFIRP